MSANRRQKPVLKERAYLKCKYNVHKMSRRRTSRLFVCGVFKLFKKTTPRDRNGLTVVSSSYSRSHVRLLLALFDYSVVLIIIIIIIITSYYI